LDKDAAADTRQRKPGGKLRYAGLVEHGPGTAGYKEAIDTQQHRASHEWGTSPSDGQLQAVAGMG